MLKIIQCVMSSNDFRACASGSCSNRTKLFVPAGALTQASGGEVMLAGAVMDLPSGEQVYLSGIVPPSVIPVLLSCSGGPMGGRPPPPPPAGGGPCCASAGTTPAASRNVTSANDRTILFCIKLFLPYPLLEEFQSRSPVSVPTRGARL